MSAGFMPMPETAAHAGGRILYGPHGEPLMVSTDKHGLANLAGGVDLSKVSQGTVDDVVAKRVRNQAASLTQVWDPRRGKPKPTSVTYDTLRMMARRNEWCAAIVKTRLNQIGKVAWSVKPKDDDDSTPSTSKLCDTVTKLLKRPSMHGSRPNSRSWRQFIGEVLRDILELDAGCIEKERNGRKWIVAMYPVDGATISPNIDDRGGYHDDAYVQIVEGQVTARFGMEDLVYIMDNPQTDIRFAGYGFSPLEHLIVSVTAELYASKYNASYFEKGAIPEGMINLGEEVSPEDVDAFRLYWMNEIMGKPWAIPIVGGKGVEWIPWRDSNKDMEYMEYQQWLLKKFCAVYQIAPQEIGELEDVNRSTADEQQQSNQTKSIEPILTLIEDYFEAEIIGDHGLGVGDLVKFEFDKEDDNEAQTDQAFSIRVEHGAATRNEWREAIGMEPAEDEGADMLLVAGQLNPLPTEQDVQVLGAAAQQQHEQEQADQQAQQMQEQGSGPGTMPWKPADPSDPDTQQAQGAHELANGLGPKQLPVGKTFEDIAKQWTKEPGGKVHEFSQGQHLWRVVKQNTAAGAPRWKATHTHPVAAPGLGRVVHKGDSFTAAKAAVEQHAASFARPTVGKSVPWDRNPAITHQHDKLETVFDAKQQQLLGTLERILGIPIGEAEDLITTT